VLSHGHEPKQPQRVVVLGCRGFVGSSVLAAVEERGWPVVGIPSADLDLTAEGAGAALAERLAESDVLVFVSALTPDRGRDAATLERNVRMARHVAEALAAQPVAHLVNVGSDAVYADDANPVRESSCASPSSLHGAMHLVREVILTDVCRAAGVPLALLRPSLLYGPGDTHNGYGPNRFVRTARGDRAIALFGEGEEQRDHVLVDDVARLVVAVLERGSTGVLNVATGAAVSFREAAETVAGLVGEDVAVQGSPRQNPITHRHFDTAATREAFPDFAWTPLSEGLRTTVAEMP
jgi:nucleoside-diphosphate-sugar epimerase